jgi:hypothetical protein
MLFSDQSGANATHQLKAGWINCQGLSHSIYQRLNSTSRNQPTVDTWLDQLRVSRYIRADDRTAKRQRLEEDSGKPFGEAGQYKYPGGKEFVTDPLIAQIAGDPHVILQAKSIDKSFDVTAHRAVTHDDQLYFEAPLDEAGYRLNEDCLALLFNDPANAH